MNVERTGIDRAVSYPFNQAGSAKSACSGRVERMSKADADVRARTGNMLTVPDIIIYLPCITLSPLLLFPGLALHSTWLTAGFTRVRAIDAPVDHSPTGSVTFGKRKFQWRSMYAELLTHNTLRVQTRTRKEMEKKCDFDMRVQQWEMPGRVVWSVSTIPRSS